MQNFKDRLKKLMERQDITSYRQLSKKTGIQASTLTRHKDEDFLPLSKDMIILASYFEVSIDWLVTGKTPAGLSKEEFYFISMCRGLSPSYLNALVKTAEVFAETTRLGEIVDPVEDLE